MAKEKNRYYCDDTLKFLPFKDNIKHIEKEIKDDHAKYSDNDNSFINKNI